MKEDKVADTTVPNFFPPKRILVPIDGSANSTRALKVASGIAKRYESELIIINVIPIPTMIAEAPISSGVELSYYQYAQHDAKQVIDEANKVVQAEGITKVKSSIIQAARSVVQEIIDHASSEKVGLIVIGTRGLGGFRRLLLGSVSGGVVTHASCDVLVIR